MGVGGTRFSLLLALKKYIKKGSFWEGRQIFAIKMNSLVFGKSLREVKFFKVFYRNQSLSSFLYECVGGDIVF